MAGSSTIGRLNVILSASADQFNTVVNGAAARLKGFAMSATSMVGSSGIGMMVANSVLNPVNAAVGVASSMLGSGRFGSGLALAEAGLGDISGATERATERLRLLEREANMVGISAGKLRGIQVFAGANADDVAPMLGKMTKMLGQLRSGDATVGGEDSITKKLGKFMDVGALKTDDTFTAFARVMEAAHNTGNEIDRNTILFTAFGKAGLAGAGMAEKGIDGLNDALERAEKLYSEGAGNVVGRIRAAEKELKLRREAADLQALFVGEAQKKADVAWAGGEGKSWLSNKWTATTRWADQAGHWLGQMIGAPGMQGPSPGQNYLARQGAGKPDKNNSAQITAMAAGKDASDKLIASLEEQAATYGLSAREIGIYKLTLEGASWESIAMANAIYDDIEHRAKAKQFRDASITQVDRLAMTFNDLSEAVTTSGISTDVARSSMSRLIAEANKLNDAGSKGASYVVAGSQQAAALMDQKSSPAINSMSDLKELIQKMVELQRDGNRAFDKYVDEFKASKPKVAIPP